MKILRHLLLFNLILLSVNLWASDDTDKALPPVPDFALSGPDKQTIRLSDLLGNIVVLNFWATWCRPCLVELPAMEAIYQEYRDKHVTVIGLNIENANRPQVEAAIRTQIEKLGLHFPILYDSEKDVLRNIEKHILGKNMGMPTTLFIDQTGKTRYIHQGYRKGDEQTYRSIIQALLQESKTQ